MLDHAISDKPTGGMKNDSYFICIYVNMIMMIQAIWSQQQKQQTTFDVD